MVRARFNFRSVEPVKLIRSSAPASGSHLLACQLSCIKWDESGLIFLSFEIPSYCVAQAGLHLTVLSAPLPEMLGLEARATFVARSYLYFYCTVLLWFGIAKKAWATGG